MGWPEPQHVPDRGVGAGQVSRQQNDGVTVPDDPFDEAFIARHAGEVIERDPNNILARWVLMSLRVMSVPVKGVRR